MRDDLVTVEVTSEMAAEVLEVLRQLSLLGRSVFISESGGAVSLSRVMQNKPESTPVVWI